MRICSFLPSATEIVYALGLGESLAGITYECDYPPQARAKRVVVNSRLAPVSSSHQLDRQVNEFMARGESLYQIDLEALRGIEPDLIITQDLCRVCAASPGDLADALTKLQPVPQVLSLNPSRLADVWNDIRAVGEAAGRGHEASSLVEELERRVAAVERAVRAAPARPRVLCLEWLDPPFVGGHWVPEMVERAGGIDVLGRASQPGFRVEWDQVLEAQPEVIVAMPCGYDLKRTIEDFKVTPLPAGWHRLPAVRASRLYAVDGSAYFSRPGPRLAAGVEILAHALHPTLAPVSPPAEAIAGLG